MLDNDFRGTNTVVAETFDNNNHIFYFINVGDEAYLRYENDIRLIRKMIIRPNFLTFFVDGGYEYGTSLLKPCFSTKNSILVKEFSIDPNIFHKLINYNLISYSKCMADLYNLPIIYSADIKYHHNDYKRSKNKEKVITKLKNGKFN